MKFYFPVVELSRFQFFSLPALQETTLETCLATKKPDVAKVWHPTKNGQLTPYDVSAHSEKIVWWKCPIADDHEWQSSVHARRTASCPYCCNLLLCNSNSLAIKFPIIASEWHPIKNGSVTPFDVIAGGEKYAWWQCPNNSKHEWESQIYCRINGNGCPICRQSTGERAIFQFLKGHNYRFQPQFKDKRCKDKRTLVFDFAVWVQNKIFLIEFQGEQHYKSIAYFYGKNEASKRLKGQQKRDEIKRNFCLQNDIKLIEIKYTDYDLINEILISELSQENTQAISVTTN